MKRKAAKELLHIQAWLTRVDEIVRRGKEAYLADDLLQEAGDSLMMKLCEAASRLSRLAGRRAGWRGVGSPLPIATSSSTSTTRATESSPGRRSRPICPRGRYPFRRSSMRPRWGSAPVTKRLRATS